MKEEKINLYGRFAIASLMFFSSFITATIGWTLLIIIAEPWSYNTVSFNSVILTFDAVYYFSGFMTILAFISPNQSLSILGYIWGKMGKLFE